MPNRFLPLKALGPPLTEGLVQGFVRRAARKAGLVNKGAHMLRHSFCSHLAMHGAPALAIQELSGHQDLNTTQRHMHLSPPALGAAVQLLETRRENAPFDSVAQGILPDTAGLGPAMETGWRRRARGASVVAGLNDVDEYDDASGETTGGRRLGGLCQQCRVTVL